MRRISQPLERRQPLGRNRKPAPVGAWACEDGRMAKGIRYGSKSRPVKRREYAAPAPRGVPSNLSLSQIQQEGGRIDTPR